MTADSPLKIQSLDEFGAYMTKEKVAKALGIARHNHSPAGAGGVDQAFGHPQRYCVKHYSRGLLARNLPTRLGWKKWSQPSTGTGA